MKRMSGSSWRMMGVLLALVLAFCAWGSAGAADNTSTVIDYTTNVTVGPFYVGNPGTNNTLLIHNGGQVINDYVSGTREAGVGYGANDTYNTAIVSGNGSLWNVTGAIFRVGRGGSFNEVIVTNGGVLRVVTNVNNILFVGGGSGSHSNLLTVTGAGSTLVTEGGTMSVGPGSGVTGNQMAITDGGTVSNAGSASLSSHYIGGNVGGTFAGGGNEVRVGGGTDNSLWILTGPPGSTNRVYLGDGPSWGRMTVSTNGVVDVQSVLTGGLSVGARNGATGNELVVTNGGRVKTVDLNVGGTFGAGAGATGNAVRVSGNGSRLDIAGSAVVGNGATSVSNALVIADRATAQALGAFIIGNSASFHYLEVSGGAALTNVNTCSVGDGGTASFNEALVSGAGTLLTTTNLSNNSLMVGGRTGNTFNRLTVSNGAAIVSGREVYIGCRSSTAGGTGNVLRVTGAGSVLRAKPDGSGLLVVGIGPSAHANRLEVLDGGLLEVGSITVAGSLSGVGLANTISNIGGIFQFTTASPTVIVNSNALGNAIVVNGGTISYRGVTAANVKGNWTGTQLTNITTWAGDNAFRLDNATNGSAVAQDYTFKPGLGATNYARLELMNDALYRGGTATIGSSGSLAVLSGTAAITNLVLEAGATFEVTLNATNDYSQLVAVGSVALGGSTLQVTLGGAPDRDGFEYVIIRKDSPGTIGDQFSVGTVVATYEGRDYPLRVSTVGGDGNDVSLSYRLQGTVLMLE